MKWINNATLIGALLVLCLTSCGNSRKAQQTADTHDTPQIQAPAFNADSAYLYIEQQVSFGPRTPNSEAHKRCGDYLVAKLESFGAKVYNQYADLMRYDGVILRARNIIGAYRPESPRRVMLCAHWDSRPWADNDLNSGNHHKPILGANDGASGVGVLLEIARQIQFQAPDIGIDIVFFDAEDSGTPQFAQSSGDNTYTWCLGSQYWARTPHVNGYNARFGILLDMVGGKNSTFLKEGISVQYASSVVDKVWRTAERLGYGAYFVDRGGAYVTDDHLPVNEIARIPCIDIINCEFDNPVSSFGTFWHTVGDDLNTIDKQTLKAVGQTVMQVIYNEK